MRATYACPSCDATVTVEGIESLDSLRCPACGTAVQVPADAIAAGTPPRLRRCLVCPSTELFVRKDFPQRLGLAIVVAGLAASCVAWAWRELVLTFAILFGTALVDVVLYVFMPDCLSCYRCGARYRGEGITGTFGGFDLETHEKHRQLAARMRGGAGPAPTEASHGS
jgi:DNA-directed RNA polymerase subunit RPC12/RpoP